MKKRIMTKITALFLLLSLLTSAGVEAYTYGSFYYHPGVQVNRYSKLPYAQSLPLTSRVFNDTPKSYQDGCHANVTSTTVRICTYGAKTGYKNTIAVIGDSHSAHWLGGLDKVGRQYGVRVLIATKSGCALSSRLRPDYPQCQTWNSRIVKAIARFHPDAVVTKANNGAQIYDFDYGMIDKFKELNSYGIKVFVIRDTVRFKTSVPQCVRTYGRSSYKCKILRSETVPDNPYWAPSVKALQNVKYVDYTDLICGPKYCSPTQGNVLMIRDKHHFSNTYSKTFSYYFARDLIPFIRY